MSRGTARRRATRSVEQRQQRCERVEQRCERIERSVGEHTGRPAVIDSCSGDDTGEHTGRPALVDSCAGHFAGVNSSILLLIGAGCVTQAMPAHHRYPGSPGGPSRHEDSGVSRHAHLRSPDVYEHLPARRCRPTVTEVTHDRLSDSCGRGRRSRRPPLPRTSSSPERQSRSSRRILAISEARSPRRDMSSTWPPRRPPLRGCCPRTPHLRRRPPPDQRLVHHVGVVLWSVGGRVRSGPGRARGPGQGASYQGDKGSGALVVPQLLIVLLVEAGVPRRAGAIPDGGRSQRRRGAALIGQPAQRRLTTDGVKSFVLDALRPSALALS